MIREERGVWELGGCFVLGRKGSLGVGRVLLGDKGGKRRSGAGRVLCIREERELRSREGALS